MRWVDLPRVKRKEMEALSVDECRRFLEVAEKSEWFPVLALALTTGMRPSEYLALKWSDIDCQRGTASVCRTIQAAGAACTFDDTKQQAHRQTSELCPQGAAEFTREAERRGRRELLCSA